MLRKIQNFIVPALLVSPLFVSAATADGLNGLLNKAAELITRLVPIVIGLALLLFLWGVLRYMFSNEEIAKAEAKNFMLWGIIALFVMVSVWGIVQIFSDTLFGEDVSDAPSVPKLPGLSR